MDSYPSDSRVNIVNSASSRSFAAVTGRENRSQSPAGESTKASMSFSESHAVTAANVSEVGLRNSST